MNNQTIAGTGSILMGFGLAELSKDIIVGLTLIGVGVVLNILVAILQKKGYQVEG